MNFVIGEDEGFKINDHFKKSKEKLRTERRFQQTNNALKQQREKVYQNGNQNNYQDQYHQIEQYMNYEQMQQFNQQAQLHYQRDQYYENYLRRDMTEQDRHIYNFSAIPQQNDQYSYQQNGESLLLQYPALSSIYNEQQQQLQSQQQVQQQQQFFRNDYYHSQYLNSEDTEYLTIKKPTLSKQQEYSNIIYEEDDNEADEETQDLQFSEQRSNPFSNNKQKMFSNFNDPLQGSNQYSNKINRQRHQSFDSLLNQAYNLQNSAQNKYQDGSSNKKITPQKFFATKHKQQMSEIPSGESKFINNLNCIQLTPRNNNQNSQAQQLYEQVQMKLTNQNIKNTIIDQDTILYTNFEIKNRYNHMQQNNYKFDQKITPEVREQRQQGNNGFNDYRRRLNFEQRNQEQTKENTMVSRMLESKNTAHNSAQNQMITIKDYEFSLNKKIGEGSFSQVYLGIKKTPPQAEVAVKIIDLQKQGTKFRDEIQICMKVNGNRNILRIYDHHIDQSSNKCYLFLEYCKQGNLQDKVSQISRRQAINYFRQILDGMKELLKYNIIHRDIKLENILINDEQVKISDFGLSKQVLNTQLDVNSIKCGTPSTMAPEIYFSQTAYPSYNNKCDVWSLGVILHEMFYKIHPFNMNKEMLRKFQRVNPENKCDIVEDFLSNCLVQNQKKRMSLEEIFNHEIYYQDLSKFKLLEDSRQTDNIKQKSHQNVQHIKNKQSNANEILQADTVQTNQPQQKNAQKYNNIQPEQINTDHNLQSNSMETFSLVKSIIYESLRGNNLGLSLLTLIFVGLLISLIFIPFIQS